METIYELGNKMIDGLTKEKVLAGDVISIDKANLLTKTGVETSLRYSSNLISVAQQIAMKRKNNTVEVEDVKRAYLLFLDSARSVKYVQENESQYIDDQGNVQISIAKSADPDAMDTTE
ncbi:CCC_1a_G0052900.mRNA.1.CDS.1 [Saccharomyces cerevisiae]|nr:CCC_1a_G0052900.mRNA.1.CDS.1 [Saccharomyces cerevisiae]CAI7472424.1 CCC_1a_G0052900.mRNA.1.CDS.1 [Saccharomyces cerevisiae]